MANPYPDWENPFSFRDTTGKEVAASKDVKIIIEVRN
jgi:hypothetical protein